MIRVYLATISLDAMAGGLEKNMILLSNYLADQDFEVHLVTFDGEGATAFYEIDDRVQWHKVGVGQPHAPISFRDRAKLIRRIRELFTTPAQTKNAPVVICYHHGILARFFLATVFTGTRIICSERNSLALYKYFSRPKWNLNFLLLSLVKKIVVQFADYIQDYPFWMRGRIGHIPNPVMPERQQATPGNPDTDGQFHILHVGRLSTQKQQHLLIEAFARIADKHPAWDLIIVGGGSLAHQLDARAKGTGLGERIQLVGKSKQVHEWMQRSHIFCLPSQWEGFPNALGEALAHGLPAVGFEACEGVNKLIIPDVNGLLAPGADDAEALAKALDALASDGELRTRLGKGAAGSIRRYQPEKIFTSWRQLLLSVAQT